jgi:hypothetical protein
MKQRFSLPLPVETQSYNHYVVSQIPKLSGLSLRLYLCPPNAWRECERNETDVETFIPVYHKGTSLLPIARSHG